MRRELATLIRLALPVTATQLGMMAMGVVDMIMIGRYSEEADPQAFGAVVLGDIWIFGTLIICLGLIMGLDPIVSQSHGAGKPRATGLALQRGMVLAGLISIPLMCLWQFAAFGLAQLGQKPELIPKAGEYASVQAFSAAPILLFQAYRQYLQGRGMMAVTLWVILIANVANVFFNWVFIFGNLGAPQLGHEGAGISTAASRCFQLLVLIIWVRGFRLHGEAQRAWDRQSFRGLSKILKHGIPISMQIGLEVWAFQAASLMAGRLDKIEGNLDAEYLSAHAVALRLASISFMIPFSISIATATRVGNLLGAQRREDASRAAWCAMGLGSVIMLVAAAIFILGRHQLPKLFNTDPVVVALAATALPIAAAFQLFDGLQAVAAGILRGMGTTLPTAIINLVGFYALAFPLAWLLAFHLEYGLAGIWWGLCSGLAAVAAALLIWVYFRGPRTHGGLADLTEDEESDSAQ